MYYYYILHPVLFSQIFKNRPNRNMHSLYLTEFKYSPSSPYIACIANLGWTDDGVDSKRVLGQSFSFLFTNCHHLCIPLSPLIFHFTLDQASEMNLEEANTRHGDYNFSIIWRGGVLVEIGISVTCCRCDKRAAWLSLATRRIKGLEEVILTSE